MTKFTRIHTENLQSLLICVTLCRGAHLCRRVGPRAHSGATKAAETLRLRSAGVLPRGATRKQGRLGSVAVQCCCLGRLSVVLLHLEHKSPRSPNRMRRRRGKACRWRAHTGPRLLTPRRGHVAAAPAAQEGAGVMSSSPPPSPRRVAGTRRLPRPTHMAWCLTRSHRRQCARCRRSQAASSC